jgi:hypothetical protein
MIGGDEHAVATIDEATIQATTVINKSTTTSLQIANKFFLPWRFS